MFVRLAVCTALLATASVASAQLRPAVGTVYFKDGTDCFDINDENGYPMCVMASNGSGWTDSAPYRKVTSMKVPFGRWVLDAKVLNYLGGNRPLNPWVCVECRLEDQGGNVIDYSSDNYGSHVDWAIGGTDFYIDRLFSAENGGIPIVLAGVLDVTARGGAILSISCRVQGQAVAQDESGNWAWGAPIQNIRFHSAQIRAVSAAAINIVK
jgi:hypothetical protein